MLIFIDFSAYSLFLLLLFCCLSGILTSESGISLLPYLKGDIFEVLVAVVLVTIVVPKVLCGPNPDEVLSSYGLIPYTYWLVIKSELSSVEWWFGYSLYLYILPSGDYFLDCCLLCICF